MDEVIELKNPLPMDVRVVGAKPLSVRVANEPIDVEVIGVRMPWGDMFKLVLQFMICSIPAALVLGVIWALMTAMFWGALMGLVASVQP